MKIDSDPRPETSVDRSFGRRLSSVVPEIRRWVARRRGVARLGRESVDDVVQSVCREALMARERGSRPDSLRAWLRTLTRRKLDDRVRHWSAEQRDAGEAEDGLHNLSAAGPSALEIAQGEELDGRVRAALGTLPADQRRVLELQWDEHLETAAIAERMERTPGAVRILRCRALAAIARELDGGQAAS